MSDSDGYFSDDLILDDQTLAVLDEEETKFKRNVSSQRIQGDVSPPIKRQRTSESCQPAKFVYRTDTSDDMDDLPDISIRSDGTYGFQDKEGPGPSRRAQVVSGPPAVAQAGPGPTSAASLSRGPTARGRPVTGPAKAVQQPRRPNTVTHAARVSPAPVLSQGAVRSQSGPSSRVGGNAVHTASDANVATLLRQMEELRKKNELMQTDLQNSRTELQTALDAKFAKEGEVTHLRKRMEKTTQDHLAQLARLKAAKEDADAKQLLLQKQYDADIQRLRTEYAFKQHELEISMRKPPGSVRSKRTARDVPSTPVHISSQTRARKGSHDAAGLKSPVPESPRRPRFGAILDSNRPKKYPSSVDPRNLPSGFQTIASSQVTIGEKGQGRAVPAIPISPARPQVGTPSLQLPISPHASSQNLIADVFSAQVDDGGMDVSAPPNGMGLANEDVIMVDGTNPGMPTHVEGDDIEEVESLNWNIILHQAILTHIDMGSQVSTLQLLMCASLSDEGQAGSYSNALSQILSILATMPNCPTQDFGQNAIIICQAFCKMVKLLTSNSLIPPLAALLCLLAHLTYIIPSFHDPLLSLPKSEQNNTPHLLSTVCGMIADLQNFDNVCKQHTSILDSLGKQALSLLEALIWNIPVENEKSLEVLLQGSTVLTVLLQPSHPPWFLVRSTQLLLLLSTRFNLHHSLVLFPESGYNKQDIAYLPQIDHICSLLADIDQTGPEADEIKSNIITFFGMLSIAHPDAFTHLVESQVLIPSIVIHLTNLVTPIWHDEPVVGDMEGVSRVVCMINQATLLLDHLVTGGESIFSLRERLYRAPTRQYHGVVHMFIRTFGRLSFLDPPDWIAGQDRQQLEQVADLAKTLLELVVEGPETECIWETYDNEAAEAQTEADDEEVEARRIELENT